MGNFRSRSGCLTCRARRVKCDETQPVCKACSKKNRPCQWETPQNKFKSYNPDSLSSSSTSANPSRNKLSAEAVDFDGGESSRASRAISPRGQELRRNYRTESRSSVLSQSLALSNQSLPGFSYLVPRSRSHSETSVPLTSLLRLDLPGSAGPFRNETLGLTRDEAALVHHFTEVLGRWLDCTDATRQFTLGVPQKIKTCPVLCHAVLCFAARHRRDDKIAQASYQRCIELLIERLNGENASHNETLLCALVILRFYEQLNGSTGTGSDGEQHLAGASAILRASQGYHFVDPSAPSLREAAFWVYVRQCLYEATINQQPPDLDFSLRLHPKLMSMRDSDSLARLRLETGWANQMTWTLACVVNFCFAGNDPPSDRTKESRIWQELWDEVQQWHRERPIGFDPTFQGVTGQTGPFPEIWFAADWHVMSFAFYHFACILLLIYKPDPKFALWNINHLSDTESQVLEHARLICGAAKSSPEMIALTIVVCHTIFIWGPLVTDSREQDEIVRLLISFEGTHLWPTTWIINALRQQWGLEE